MNTCQSNTFRKDLSWLHFDDEPRGHEKKQDWQTYIPVSVTYLTYPMSNQEHQLRQDNSIPYEAEW